jgi:hypothetical protein
VWDSRWEDCFAVFREGETAELEMEERWAKEVYRRDPGNLEDY